MTTAPALASFAGITDGRADQRAHRRYPISLILRYKLLSNGRVVRSGSGQTLNLSTGGAYFECVDPLPVAGTIELVLNWPFLLAGTCPLKLIMFGNIVRVKGKCVAFHTLRHEFRTAGVRALSAPSQHLT